MTGDGDRAQVYAAELAAFDGTDLERVVGTEAVAKTIARIVDDPWWPGGAVTVRRMRTDARSSATRCLAGGGGGGPVDIGVAETQATLATAAHELAHALAGVAHGHDATFRRAHLDVVLMMTNVDRVSGRGTLHADQLRDSYVAAGLVVGERSWPEPPPVGGAIAL